MYKIAAAFSLAVLLASSASVIAATSEDVISEAKQYVENSSRNRGEWPGPTQSPPMAEGKSITIISCHQASNCAIDAAGAKEAATAAGWTATVVDGKGDPAIYNAAIRTAVNAGVDGIITIAIAPSLIRDGLRYAQERDIPVVNGAEIASDSDLFAAHVDREFAAQGEQMGKWMIADSGGTAKAVLLRADEFQAVIERQSNVAKAFENCADCKILDSVNLTVSQGANPSYIQQLVQSLVARFGDDLNYIVSPYGTLDGLIVPALRAAGRSDVKVVGYDGNAQQMQLCRQGQVGAVAVTLLSWSGWAGVDQMNRVFNKSEPQKQNIPAFMVVKATCPETGLAEQAYDIDFRDHYKKMWGKK
ncbi:substrate-binding domain-containing protein [Brucella sp. BE17]|uniref:sugar ABC transporter substrate-binding protein n=1 Tax=Brucella sp. BE17 TaxID=3142977 RepID=UPI0031BBA315